MVNTLSVLALASGAFAATVQVAVGSGGNVFTPSTITAATGDVVEFTFSGSHSVASGDFASPCSSSGSSDIYSGTMSSGVFSVKVNSTAPIWLYCAYRNHCQEGMVAVINAPSSGDTLDSYTSGASSSSKSSPPSGVQNGIVGDASEFGASASSAAPASGTGAASGVSSDSAAQSTAATSAGSTGSSTTSSGTAATSSSAAEKVAAFGVAGLAGLFAAIFA